MTDRWAGVVVTFDENIREDDAGNLVNAILALRHVIKVTPVGNDPGQVIAESRVRHELGQKLLKVLYPNG